MFIVKIDNKYWGKDLLREIRLDHNLRDIHQRFYRHWILTLLIGIDRWKDDLFTEQGLSYIQKKYEESHMTQHSMIQVVIHQQVDLSHGEVASCH